MTAYNFSERVRRVLGTATEEAARFDSAASLTQNR